MALKNKQLILDYIRDNPDVSKRQTADHFSVSIDCIARLRREANKTALAKTCKSNLSKPHIQNEPVTNNHNITTIFRKQKEPQPVGEFDSEKESWPSYFKRSEHERLTRTGKYC